MTSLELRTAAWHGDRVVELDLPPTWDGEVFRPDTPPPLTDADVAGALERPVAQAPIRELARGKERPVVVVDDLTRPTPVDRVLTHLLHQFEAGGIPRARVSIVIATGAHPPPPSDGVHRKLGDSRGCRVMVHDCTRDLTRVGRTSFGSPVLVNRDVAASDFIVGIGGIYPQHSTGFGGGSKLALGVLGKSSIIRLHYGHESAEGSYDVENDFRRELDEIAGMIGLGTMISVHVDADRRIVRLTAGDRAASYAGEVAFARRVYRAPVPGDADVVISNAYPVDGSLTFVRSKGLIPLLHADRAASRVAIASCSEGVGHHGLFPFVTGSRLQPAIQVWRRARTRPGDFPARVARAVGRRWAGARSVERPGILLYRPDAEGSALPKSIPGMREVRTWSEVVRAVEREQVVRKRLRVVVYACAPLQVLELEADRRMSAGSTGLVHPTGDG